MTDTSVLHMTHGHDGDGRCITLGSSGEIRPAYDWTTGISKTRAAGDAPSPVARCLCCGDEHTGPTLLCTECRAASCEETRDAAGELGYWQCQLPPEVDTGAEFYTCPAGHDVVIGEQIAHETWCPPLAEPDRFARYHSQEVAVTFFNGCGYVVRHDEYPHTTWPSSGRQVTRQGHAMLVGARQGTGELGGFKVTRWTLPDTTP